MNKKKNLWTLAAAFVISIGSASSSHALDAPGALGAYSDAAVLNELQTLYGLDENSAIERLAREADAAESYRAIEELQLKSYAGSWFDGDSLMLNVAIADPADGKWVRQVGANPVVVARPLTQLMRTMEQVAARVPSSAKPGLVVESYIDYPSNSVVLGVLPHHAESVRSELQTLGMDTRSIRVVEVPAPPKFTSGAVRGANGTRNWTWAQQYPGTEWPCSIGASVEGGYITAGHCGYVNNVILSPGGEKLGDVKGSITFTAKRDSGWVKTTASWQPQPYVNGYAQGLISVAAKWSGTNEAPVGSTVCRYGQTSGADCGTIAAKNLTIWMGTYPNSFQLLGVVKASGICTDDGDSGGPYVAATGQIQGTNIGGSPTNTCPTPANAVYYQPIVHAIDAFGLNMLTAHGSKAPTVANFRCPDLNNSGSGQYACKIDYYNSQGRTTTQWSASSGHSSSGSWLFGSCVRGQYVSVTFTASNPYGTFNQTASFLCPTGPIP